MPPDSAPLCCSQGVGPTLPSATVCQGLDQLSCSHTLGVGSPVPLASGPAPLYCADEAQDLFYGMLQPVRIQDYLSGSMTPGSALLDTAGGEEGRRRESTSYTSGYPHGREVEEPVPLCSHPQSLLTCVPSTRARGKCRAHSFKC